MSDVIARAAEFAEAAHVSIDQRRKYSHLPYIVHPREVAGIVAEVTEDEATIAAAWLHDVVEDTPVTLEEVASLFGSDVARLVDDLTDVALKSDGNRARRAEINRDHTAQADPRAKTVKLADVLHNVSDIVEQDPGFARVYVREKELLLPVLKEGNATLYERAEQLMRDSRDRLGMT